MNWRDGHRKIGIKTHALLAPERRLPAVRPAHRTRGLLIVLGAGGSRRRGGGQVGDVDAVEGFGSRSHSSSPAVEGQDLF